MNEILNKSEKLMKTNLNFRVHKIESRKKTSLQNSPTKKKPDFSLPYSFNKLPIITGKQEKNYLVFLNNIDHYNSKTTRNNYNESPTFSEKNFKKRSIHDSSEEFNFNLSQIFNYSSKSSFSDLKNIEKKNIKKVYSVNQMKTDNISSSAKSCFNKIIVQKYNSEEKIDYLPAIKKINTEERLENKQKSNSCSFRNEEKFPKIQKLSKFKGEKKK